MRVGRLSVVNGEDKGKSFLLKNLSVFEGGKSPGNHVLLRDPSVAMSHFRVCRTEDNEYSIYDLGTKSGTLVNGSQVEKAFLIPGDVVQVGALKILFDHVDENTPGRVASSAPDLEELTARDTPEAGHADDASDDDSPEGAPSIIVVEGEEKGRAYPLTGKTRFTIGRSAQSDLRLRDAKVSREHCVVEVVRDHFIVVDKESANGTVVNGERVRKTVLKEGDYIRLGFTILKFDRV